MPNGHEGYSWPTLVQLATKAEADIRELMAENADLRVKNKRLAERVEALTENVARQTEELHSLRKR